MTLEELADSIAMQWGKENDYATMERIKLLIIAARATIIQRRYDQTKIFPQSIIMTLDCQHVVKVDAIECGCVTSCGYVWRSEKQIPLSIIVKDDSYFMFVGGPKGVKSFSALRPEEVQDIEHRRFSGNENFYFYSNNFLYFVNPLKSFTARFVPENPLAVLELGTCTIGCIQEGELILEDSLIEGIKRLLDRDAPMNPEKINEVTIDGDN